MTRSTGTSGLIFCGLPPSLVIASRIAARSTTAGTPVKSCIRTRGRTKRDLAFGFSLVGHPGGDRFDVFLGDGTTVLKAQQIFEQYLHSKTAVEKYPRARSSRQP